MHQAGQLLASGIRPATEFCARALHIARIGFAHEGGSAECPLPHIESKAEKGGTLAVGERLGDAAQRIGVLYQVLVEHVLALLAREGLAHA